MLRNFKKFAVMESESFPDKQRGAVRAEGPEEDEALSICLRPDGPVRLVTDGIDLLKKFLDRILAVAVEDLSVLFAWVCRPVLLQGPVHDVPVQVRFIDPERIKDNVLPERADIALDDIPLRE